jgi:hypothetical protein
MATPCTRMVERGQAVLEVIIVLPLLIGVFFLALAFAAGWNVHHLSASLSLEGASLQSAVPGRGVAFLGTTGRVVAPSAGMSPEVADFGYAWLVGSGVQGERFTVHGGTHLPWAPFGLALDAPVRGTTYTPIWEFNGAP